MSHKSWSPASELEQDSWSRLRQATARLEQAWRADSQPPSLADIVQAESDSRRACFLVELIKVDQEHRWRRGDRRLLEAYVSDWPELSQHADVLRELLQAECETRAVFDCIPEAAELQSRFPTLAGTLDLTLIAREVAGDRAAYLTSVGGQLERARQGNSPLAIGVRFGRYEIREWLGQGAMGVVYRALDSELRRDVALKLPQLDPTVDAVTLERFLREARSAAAVHHPNICPIYEAGQVGSTYFIAMAFIDGESLAARLRREPFTPLAAAELIGKLAKALDKLHAAGIVHRDIKPSNVMLTGDGEPILMDFGLAKPQQDEQHLTHTGSFLGTPAYLSPEQVSGGATAGDHRSDLFSLGVLFYQLLTGHLPFPGPLPKLFSQIEHADPLAPRTLRPELDEELVCLCLKLLAKRPDARFQSARELAEALSRLATLGRPSAVAPSFHTGRGRRRPALLTAVVACAVLLAGVVIYINTGEGQLELTVNEQDITVKIDGQLQTIDLQSPRDRITVKVSAGRQHQLEVTKDGFTTETRQFSVRRNGKVELSATLKPRESGVEHRTPKPASSAATLTLELTALSKRVDAVRSNDPTDPKVVALRDELLAVTRQQPGSAAAQEAAKLLMKVPSLLDALRREDVPPYELKAAGFGDPQRAPAELVAVLGDSRLRHWGDQYYVAISPDGRRLLTGGHDRTVTWWDAASGEMQAVWPFKQDIRSVLFTPDGTTVIVGEDSYPSIKFRDAVTGITSRQSLPGDPQLALSRDGELLVSGQGTNGEVQIWDLKNGKLRHTLKGHTGPTVTDVAISLDRRTAASAGDEGTVRVWDIESGHERHVLRHVVDGRADGVAFSPDGKQLASAGDGGVKIWDLETGELQQTISKGKATSVAFGSDGKFLAWGAYQGSVHVWDLMAQREHRVLSCPPGEVIDALLFQSDRRTVVAACRRQVRLWDAETGEAKIPPRHHNGFVTHMTLAPDGRTLVTAGHDGLIILWDLLTQRERSRIRAVVGHVSCVVFSPDGQKLATAHSQAGVNPDTLQEDLTVKLWDEATGRLEHTLWGHGNQVLCVAFSPDGKTIASGAAQSGDNTVKLWDVETAQERLAVKAIQTATSGVAFSPDGKTLAVRTHDENNDDRTSVRLLDAQTGEEQRRFAGGHHWLGAGSSSIVFSPDGRWLAATGRGSPDHHLKLWDVATGKELRTFEEGFDWAVFTSDGSRLISAGPNATIKFWNPNPPAGTPLLEQTIHLRPAAFRHGGGWIDQLLLAPDGRHLFSLNSNGTVYVLRLETPHSR